MLVRIINAIIYEIYNNKQCAEFYLGTAPWTSTYIIINNHINDMWA